MKRTCLLSLLASLLLLAAARAESPDDPVRKAVEKGLRRLQEGAGNYIKNRDCFSCHHQATSILCLSSAKQRGFTVEPAILRQQIDFTRDSFKTKLDRIAKGQGLPGANTMAVYALLSLEASEQPADETTSSLIQFLLTRQRPDGSWNALADRPPSEGSSFTNTALALRNLRVYGPTRDSKSNEEQRRRATTAFDKGKDWLIKNTPKTMEDRIFHLHGLVEAGVEKEKLQASLKGLLQAQRENGSWSQLPDREGDAYATGTALFALRRAGLTIDDPAYRKAVKYLLAEQREDGSWFVASRSRPVQVFFDNGDPGGKSQFISFAGTGWAVLALLETFPTKTKE